MKKALVFAIVALACCPSQVTLKHGEIAFKVPLHRAAVSR
jgi:hypothetical protein